MRKRILLGVLVLIVLLACSVVPAYARTLSAEAPIPSNEPSSGKLVENPKTYNGTTVTFTGEAIGEVMARGEYAWIHLNDDAYMEMNVEEGAKLGGYNSGMAVWVPTALTKQIDTYGDYKHEGSIVQVVGTFNAACKEHGGDMDIHATAVTLIRPGHVVDDPIAPWKATLAVALVLAAAGLWWLDRVTRNRISPHRGV
jgi:hypothetical protein